MIISNKQLNDYSSGRFAAFEDKCVMFVLENFPEACNKDVTKVLDEVRKIFDLCRFYKIDLGINIQRMLHYHFAFGSITEHHEHLESVLKSRLSEDDKMDEIYFILAGGRYRLSQKPITKYRDTLYC